MSEGFEIFVGIWFGVPIAVSVPAGAGSGPAGHWLARLAELSALGR